MIYSKKLIKTLAHDIPKMVEIKEIREIIVVLVDGPKIRIKKAKKT